MAHPDSVSAIGPMRTITPEDPTDMPMTRRGTSILLDTIDEHGAAVTRTSLTLRTALLDGAIDPAEQIAIDRCLDDMQATYQLVSRNGDTLDQTFTMIRGLAHAADIMAPQVQRSFREFTQDRQRLDASVPAVTSETTYAAD